MSFWDSFSPPYSTQPSTEPTAGTSEANQQTSKGHSSWAHDHSTYPSYGYPGVGSDSIYHYPQNFTGIPDDDHPFEAQSEHHEGEPEFSISECIIESPLRFHETSQPEYNIDDIPTVPGSPYAAAHPIKVSEYLHDEDPASQDRPDTARAEASSLDYSSRKHPLYKPFMHFALQYAGTGVPSTTILKNFNAQRQPSDHLAKGTVGKWLASYNFLNPSNPIGTLPKFTPSFRKEVLAFVLSFKNSVTTNEIVDFHNSQSKIKVSYTTVLLSSS